MLCIRKVFVPLKTFARHFQVTVLGAATEIGQTVTLLLRAQPAVTKLVTHDYAAHSPGVLLDVSHIPSSSVLEGYSGEETLLRALSGSNLVIIAGGVTMKPNWTKRSCFAANASFINKVAAKIAKTSPMPFVGIVTEPINIIVPMAAEVMRNHGDYDERKLFGITGIDLLRTQCLYAAENKLTPQSCYVPVIGGHSDKTTIPLLSQANPAVPMDEGRAQEFSEKIRKGDDIVTRAKMGRSPTLSVAYSVLVFVRGILQALEGHPSKVQAYVENNDFGTAFFSGLVSVSKDGAGDMQRYHNLSNLECYFLEQSIGELKKDISKGTKLLERGPTDLE